MIKNLLKHSFRSLRKQRSFVCINVIGLSIGLACTIIIALFIQYELSYDRYNEHRDRIYRVILHGKLGGQELQVTSTASIIAPTMLNEFPEVESFLRINGQGRTNLKYEEKFFMEDDFIEADSTFFKFFSIPLIQGDRDKVLSEPYYVVLSETTAKKIFGHEDPINKLIRIGNDETHYKVTGVMADIPENTHFRASLIGSFMTNPRASENEWLSNSFDSYVMLKPASSPEDVNERFAPMIEKYVGPIISEFFGITMEEFFEAGNKYRLFLQPLVNIHLEPGIEQGLKPANDPKYLWIFGSVALLIIIIAAVNFMNLSTAQSLKRAKEIGVKKVCGSSQAKLVWQFLLETFLLSFVALLVAILITEFSLPYFNNLLGLDLQIAYFRNWYTIPALLLLCVMIGFLAGIYPAFYVSSFNPTLILKGKFRSGKENGRLRSALVVIQFSISIVLIIGTIIMFRQLNYMQSKDLGFDKERIFVISNASAIGSKISSFKEELLQLTGVEAVSASTAVPGRNNNNNGYGMKGRQNESFLLNTTWADKDFLATYGIPLQSGVFFDDNTKNDLDGCIINHTAVRHYMLEEDPFATRFYIGEDLENPAFMPVIGVVEDFHHESLRYPITPYMIRFKNENVNWGYISIRLSGEIGENTIGEIEMLWESFTEGSPMQSFFMEDAVRRMYREERQNGQLSVLFAIIGIIIAALGLFGLTSYSIAQRTKEIGIRKTYGASVSAIWYLFSREIIILVFIATVIAVPLIWWVADGWLQNYPYRVGIGLFDFVVGFLVAILVALGTISYRTIRSARMNPSSSLRYE
ncbi:MAG: FtsX-like permease family protein [Bacteroidales bacterium]|nr:FtsX-like permease family protein [Bacteroidales bacterium]